MKNKHLQQMLIRNDGKIVPRWRKLKIATGVICTALSVGVVYAGINYGKIMFDSYEQRNATYEQSMNDSLSGKETGLTKSIAKIISREGELPQHTSLAYADWILEAAAKHRVDPILILSVMSVESRFDYSVVSKGNAIGLMQVIHSWHQEKSSKTGLFDPKNNIEVGTRIIAEYARKSDTLIETLLRYNGSFGQAPVYAMKVLDSKKRYQEEVFRSVTDS
jgi:soluble lytic murein transglycosylase-like protein